MKTELLSSRRKRLGYGRFGACEYGLNLFWTDRLRLALLLFHFGSIRVLVVLLYGSAFDSFQNGSAMTLNLDVILL